MTPFITSSALGPPVPISIFTSLKLPMILQPMPCGFPSPAQDYLEKRIDLNEIIVRNPTATFVFIAQGNSMIHAGIIDGALLVVDRSVSPRHGHIVLACVDGDFTVKRLDTKDMCLMPENPEYEPIRYADGMELHVWGVIINIIIDPYKSYVRTG